MIYVSICVPTYNRAKMLRQCLEHLSQFQDPDFELIIGDNASSDDTPEVVDSLRSRFRHLTYLRHDENIGFARNMDALLRRATRPFLYILNDDDLVFEGALGLASSVLRGSPQVVAMVGQYVSVRSVDPTMRVDYGDAVATMIRKGQHMALLNNLIVCDGHPVLRRETFERHGAYLDRTGVLTPLYFSLLNHGDLVIVDKPFFQHRTSRDSLSGRMVEAWFLDMSTADLELAVSGCFGTLPPDALPAARQWVFQILYFQAVRMAINQRSPYLAWFFLRRLTGLCGVTEDLLLKCEYNFTHDLLAERIASMLKDARFETVHFLPSPVVEAAIPGIARLRPEARFIAIDPGAVPDGVDLVLCEDREAVPAGASVPRVYALNDLFGQFRLTPRAARLTVNQGRVVAGYQDESAIALLIEPTRAFELIRAPYSEAS